MVYNFVAKDLSDLDKISSKINAILQNNNDSNVILFKGAMGAGKTTLIRTLCHDMGVTDTVTSPTFAIVNEYEKAGGELIYHFDFYRVDSIREVYDLGYETYFDSGHLCFIEWPERIAEIIEQEVDTKFAVLTIDVDSSDQRVISLEI